MISKYLWNVLSTCYPKKPPFSLAFFISFFFFQFQSEEVQDLQVDLEVKEAGFNNSFRENEESHKEEIEILVSKIEQAKAEISDLNEKLAR